MVSEASTSQPSTSLHLDSSSGSVSEADRGERSKLDERDTLIPTLPDDFTNDLILPRLPWRVMLKLTQLNRSWRAAVRRPEVYDLRARASTSQTIVTTHQHEWIISLYDTATETWHRLPRPPFDHRLIPKGFGCVTSQGKLYILGGNGEDFLPRNDVHMFELAGQGCWKKCASMKTPRKHFACAVQDGKIYVFGGIGAGNAAEVYNPQQDSWCDIAPMLNHRIEHKSVNIGNVFCVHMGRYLESSSKSYLKWGYAHFAEIYDPRRDCWIAVTNFSTDISPNLIGVELRAEIAEAVVAIDGALYGILDDWLYVYEEPSNFGTDSKALKWDGTGSWRAVQLISWDVFRVPGAVDVNCFNPFARLALVVPNGEELLALVFGPTGSMNNNRRWTFLKSQGLGCVDRELIWKEIDGSANLTLRAWNLWTDDESFQFAPCIASIAGAW